MAKFRKPLLLGSQTLRMSTHLRDGFYTTKGFIWACSEHIKVKCSLVLRNIYHMIPVIQKRHNLVIYFKRFLYIVCVCTCLLICHDMYRSFRGVNILLLPGESWELNSGHGAQWQVPLHPEQSRQPRCILWLSYNKWV